MSTCHGFDVDVIPSHTRHPPKQVREGHGENIRTRPRPVLTRTRDPSRVTIPVSITTSGSHKAPPDFNQRNYWNAMNQFVGKIKDMKASA